MVTLSICTLFFLMNSSIDLLNNVSFGAMIFSKRARLMFWLQSMPSISDSTKTWADGIDDKMCFTSSAVWFNLTIVLRLSRGSNFHFWRNSAAKYSLNACVSIFPPRCGKWMASTTLYRPLWTFIIVMSELRPPKRTTSTLADSSTSTPKL